VHLVEVAGATSGDVGALDHFAFHAGDFDGLTGRLSAHGHAFESRVVPGSGRRQVFVRDPNGVRVELNFPPA
jgi:catechol 2,3-dioxygenase-like lactoylglutathione lyase family enzyme